MRCVYASVDLHGQVGIVVDVPPEVYEFVRLVVHLAGCLALLRTTRASVIVRYYTSTLLFYRGTIGLLVSISAAQKSCSKVSCTF